MIDWLIDLYTKFTSKHVKVLFIGYENSGKSQIINAIISKRLKLVESTIYPTNYLFRHENILFDICDTPSFAN